MWKDKNGLHFLVLVAFGQCHKKVGIGAQIKRSLSFLIFDLQVCTIASKEACNCGRSLFLVFVLAVAAKTHEQLKNEKLRNC